MNNRLTLHWQDFLPDLPTRQSPFETMITRTVVLNKDHRDFVVARPPDEDRNSAD